MSDWIALLSQQPTRPKTNEEKQRATFDMNYEICVKSTPHILTTIDRRVNSGDEAINIHNPTSRIKTDTWCVSMKWQHPVFTCRFSDCVPESCIFSPPVMTTENTTWSTISSFTLLIIPYSYNNTIYFLRYQKSPKIFISVSVTKTNIRFHVDLNEVKNTNSPITIKQVQSSWIFFQAGYLRRVYRGH